MVTSRSLHSPQEQAALSLLFLSSSLLISWLSLVVVQVVEVLQLAVELEVTEPPLEHLAAVQAPNLR
jgi:hypothetical protein